MEKSLEKVFLLGSQNALSDEVCLYNAMFQSTMLDDLKIMIHV